MYNEFTNLYNQEYRNIVSLSTIFPKIKIELLDTYENVIGEITQDIDRNSGSISINYQQGVRRSCNLTLTNIDGKYSREEVKHLLGFNTKFKLYVGLLNPNTNNLYWFSQGVFYTINPNSSHSNKTISISGVDKFGFLTSETGYNQLEGTYIVPQGSNLYSAIKDLLTLDLGNGLMIDPIDPILDRKFMKYTVPFEVKKSPGSHIGDIIIQLANVLGADVYYDTEGHLVITSGTSDIFYSQKSSMWDYTDVLPEYMDSSVSLNTASAINTVKVVGQQINNGTIFIGNAENHNPLSPTAIEKIGRKIYYEDGANLPNQQAADEYARYVLNSKSIIQTAIAFNSTLVPHLDVNNIITISDKYYGYDQERFIIQNITMPLNTSGTMNINCNNIASLPYYDLRTGG